MRNQTTSPYESIPAPDDVREQLTKILSSKDFILPDRGRRFLQFIVIETLEGRGVYLKAFTIAQAIFGRDATFDAQGDPCVRIAARQLRSSLERYYLMSGAEDDVLIAVPAGGYVPTFVGRGHSDGSSSDGKEQAGTADMSAGNEPVPVEARKSEGRVMRWIMIVAVMIVLAAVIMASLAEWGNPALKTEVTTGGKARIVVDPFQSADHSHTLNDISIGLTGEIILSLSKFRDLVVIAKDVAAGTAADPSYTLKGNVRLEGDDMRSTARLVRQVDGVVVWSGDYSVDIKGRSMLDIEAGIGRSIASAVAAPFEARATSGSGSPALSSAGK